MDPRRRLNAGLAAVAILALMYVWQPQRVDSAIDLAINWRGENIEGVSIDARTGDYEIVARMVSEHPLIGEGYGAHVSFALDNEYLDTAIESGLFGVLALLAVLIVPFWVAGSRADARRKTRGDPAEADFAVAFAASLSRPRDRTRNLRWSVISTVRILDLRDHRTRRCDATSNTGSFSRSGPGRSASERLVPARAQPHR